MSRTVPNREAAAAARFNQQTVIRSVNHIQQALGHSNSRNSRVAQTLTYFSLIRNSGQHAFLTSAVAIEKAVRQLFKSHNGHQAAHYLPGQIWIDLRHPWSYINHRPTGLRLECLFADVEDLPSDFNKADSAAEDKGLCEAFRAASEVILHQPGPGSAKRASRELIRHVYDDIWVPQALNAFSLASAQKETRAGVPEPQYDEYRNIINMDDIAAVDDGWDFDHQRRILQRYAETMRNAPPDLRDDKIVAIEHEFQP